MKCFTENGNGLYITKSLEDTSGSVIRWDNQNHISFLPFAVGFYLNRKEVSFPNKEQKSFIIYCFQCSSTGRNIEAIRKCL